MFPSILPIIHLSLLIMKHLILIVIQTPSPCIWAANFTLPSASWELYIDLAGAVRVLGEEGEQEDLPDCTANVHLALVSRTHSAIKQHCSIALSEWHYLQYVQA
jgi:hypothetical protein